jgi:capsular exopolysaccharide synthesis family protein
MGRTHEALERAEKEYQETLVEKPLASETAVVPKRPKQYPIQAPLDRYQEVKIKLITCFPEESIKTILVTGTAHGDGASTTAVSFATTLARDCKLKVLLIDVNLRHPSLHEVFNIKYNKGLSNLLTDKDKPPFYKKVGHGDLYVIPSGGKHKGPLTLFESKRFDDFLKKVREDFAYVIMDAPPVNTFSEPRVIGTKVDGGILVVESGKTRRQVAIRTKQELEEAGIRILGVILNRRKHYIPNWIYKRL